MIKKDVRRYEMLVRVSAFGADHAALFPVDSLAAMTFAALGETMRDLRNQMVMSEGGVRHRLRETARSKAAARAALRGEMARVVQTARALALDTTDALMFRFPRNQNDPHLITAARVFVARAAPLAPSFVAHGLPEAFVADLESALGAFERAASDRETARQARAGACAGVAVGLKAASAHLTRLDAIVKNRVRDNPTLCAAWVMARRVGLPRVPADRASGQPAATASPVPAE